MENNTNIELTRPFVEERKIDKRASLYKDLQYKGLFSKLSPVAGWFPYGRLLWYTTIKQQRFLLQSHEENNN